MITVSTDFDWNIEDRQVKVTFKYFNIQPYFVTIEFNGEPTWEFGRDLITEVFQSGKSGMHNVLMELDLSSKKVIMTLVGPGNEQFIIMVPSAKLYRFLWETVLIVPIGQEKIIDNIDSDLEDLFKE